MLRIVLAMALAVPNAAPARDREPEVLARTGKWALDYDRDGCHLFAQFGAQGKETILRFSRYEPGDLFDLSLYGDKARSRQRTASAKLTFGPGGAPFEVTARNGTASNLEAMLLGRARLDGARPKPSDNVLPPVTPEQEASVTGLTVEIARHEPFRLEFGSLAEPMAQMRSCSADLVRTWGYDPEEQARLSRRVTPINPGSGSARAIIRAAR